MNEAHIYKCPYVPGNYVMFTSVVHAGVECNTNDAILTITNCTSRQPFKSFLIHMQYDSYNSLHSRAKQMQTAARHLQSTCTIYTHTINTHAAGQGHTYTSTNAHTYRNTRTHTYTRAHLTTVMTCKT